MLPRLQYLCAIPPTLFLVSFEVSAPEASFTRPPEGRNYQRPGSIPRNPYTGVAPALIG